MASYYGYKGPEPPEEYLENKIFPVLLPAMEEMLRVETRTEKRKRFNPLDFLTTYLYNNNPLHSERENTQLADIPFVKEEWAVNPRPPLPLSATLTEEEAATIIQAHYRSYLVRKNPEGQLFRTWQRNLWDERRAASRIKTFMRRASLNLAKKRNSAIQEELRLAGIPEIMESSSGIRTEILDTNTLEVEQP